jgi:hypothetical protein
MYLCRALYHAILLPLCRNLLRETACGYLAEAKPQVFKEGGGEEAIWRSPVEIWAVSGMHAQRPAFCALTPRAACHCPLRKRYIQALPAVPTQSVYISTRGVNVSAAFFGFHSHCLSSFIQERKLAAKNGVVRTQRFLVCYPSFVETSHLRRPMQRG